jgi:hypothetical protein
MKKYLFIFILSALAFIEPVFSQKYVASVGKNKVAVGERFMLSYTLNTSGSNFKFPNLNDFDVYSGPNQSTNMQFINGSMSQSITMSFILAAKKEGKFTIGPSSVVVNGNVLQSNPVTIEVSGSGGQGGSAQSPTAPTENVADNLFIKTTLSKTRAYMGEQITVSYKVYTRYTLRGFQDVKFPDFNGFWSQDMPMNQQIQLNTENVDGTTYYVAELKRSFIFAQRTGKLEIDAPSVECVVRKQSNKRYHDPFDAFFGGGYEDKVYTIKGRAASVEIIPLPEEGKPENFSGAVGEFSMKMQLNKDKAKTNEGLNLAVTLTGKGNIKLVEALKIPFPDDFETYDPKTNENISIGINGVSGTKTFEYLLIPRHAGSYKLDRLNFSYFDPEKKQYISLPSPEMTIEVEKGNDDPATVVTGTTRQEELKVLGNDIRYIKTQKPELLPSGDYFFGSPSFYALLISPFILFAGFLVLRKKNIEMNKDAVAVKSRKANKMAKKRLQLAEGHMRSGNKEAFYSEISKALYGYISDKLNIPAAELNKDTISARLQSKNVSANSVMKLLQVLDNCEYARYAPSAVSGNLQSIYSDTVALITDTENEIS